MGVIVNTNGNVAEPHKDAVALFGQKARATPVRALGGLFVEYLMFAAALFLAGSLLVTRAPLGWFDRLFGLRLRERLVELLARVSPG